MPAQIFNFSLSTSAAKSLSPSIFATPATWTRAWSTPSPPTPPSSAVDHGIDRLLALVPPAARERVEVPPHSATEVGLLLHGLEFARVRHGVSAHSFSPEDEVTFGAGANETPLTAGNRAALPRTLPASSSAAMPTARTPIRSFACSPSAGLSRVSVAALRELLPTLRGDLLYSQVPALSTGDRGMLDLLTLDRNGRLVVIELKADEDLHLPLQALDYWIRVRALNADRIPTPGSARHLSAFERHGYFTGAEVSPLPPRIVLAAPALRIHPANEPVLRYLSPEIEWELVALSEDWRRELRVVFRKHSGDCKA